MIIQSKQPLWMLSQLAEASSEKPVVVFVPDSWHNAHVFHLVTDLLEDAGYSSVLVHNPSVANSQQGQLPDSANDIQTVREVVERIVPYNEVIVIAHGHGSIPTCDAVKGLDIESCKAQGFRGGVRHLLFCSAFLPIKGQSVAAAYGQDDLPVSHAQDQQPASLFFNDLDSYAAQLWSQKLRQYESVTLNAVCGYTAWKDIPSTYLFTTKDNAIPYVVQQKMVERASVTGAVIGHETLESGHNPFLSVPYQVAKIIKKLAGDI